MKAMTIRVSPSHWIPQGIDELEYAANEAVRSTVHTLVVAGPGAGKTELLAQRACYLLQAGLCPSHRRILAISFKRDAAKNLLERVRHRCGEELSRRFHSLTFDAFAKGLVDRFGQSLPAQWRPSRDFLIEFGVERQFGELLTAIPRESVGLSASEIASIVPGACYKQTFIGRSIGDYPEVPPSTYEKAALAVWDLLLHSGNKSALNFQMIGRLAEHVLSTTPKLLAALRAAYAYVFLDEFQDTTSIQYDLMMTAFGHSKAILTAVGDSKQCIMRWAMALKGIFQQFQTDFHATVRYLRRNYRSAPLLVKVIAHITAAMDPQADLPEPIDEGHDGEGECRVLLFPDSNLETEILTGLIREWLAADGLPPREICILTRQKTEKYAGPLIDALKKDNINIRVENNLQDLLSEPSTTFLLDCLKLAIRRQAPESWQRLIQIMMAIRGDDSQRSAREVSDNLAVFKAKFADAIASTPRDKPGIGKLVKHAVGLVSYDGLVAQNPRYEQGNFLEDQLTLFVAEMAKYGDIPEWSDAIDKFEGLDSIPAMTIHKSKGLEYHTIVFVGLEDYVFRSFKQVEDDEETCAFFVALSRAKKRVLFTFSRDRQGLRQTLSSIRPLYQLLIDAGIKPEEFKR